MMTTTQARRVSALLAAHDQISEWLESFDKEEKSGTQDYIQFADIGHSESPSCEEVDGWVGALVLPRNVAIRMLAHEIEAISAELASMGITDSHPVAVAAEAL